MSCTLYCILYCLLYCSALHKKQLPGAGDFAGRVPGLASAQPACLASQCHKPLTAEAPVVTVLVQAAAGVAGDY